MPATKHRIWTKPSRLDFDGEVARLFCDGRLAVVSILDSSDAAQLPQHRWLACRAWGGNVYVRGSREPRVYLHKHLMGAGPDVMVDHINGDTLDNRRINLRIATLQQNNQNRRGFAQSGWKGVYRIPHKARRQWFSAIYFNGCAKRLGSFATPEEAALAYDTAAKQFFGEFARLNFPDGAPVSHGQHHAGSSATCLPNIHRVSAK